MGIVNIHTLQSKLLKAKNQIKKQKELIKELELENNSFPLRLFMMMMDVMQDPKYFHYPDVQSIKVIDPVFNEITEMKLKASDIVCITAVKGTRKKNIYVNEADKSKKDQIKQYIFNNNDHNFNSLCQYLDPLSHSLVVVSKDAIVNVEYFDKSNGSMLTLNKKLSGLEKLKPIALSKALGLDNFIKVKEDYRQHISLQKRLFDYKTRNNIPD